MRIFDTFTPASPDALAAVQQTAQVRHVIQRRLHRVLAFTRLTIDDVINNPVARNTVRGYWKLSNQVDRHSEITELERQWNPNGLSTF